MRTLIFVPGIMGSALRYRGPDAFGVQVDRVVWGNDVQTCIHTLAVEPQLLLSDKNVSSDGVIRELRSLVGPTPLYGPLLDLFIAPKPHGLGYTPENILICDYDWRQCNEVSARAIADRIEREHPTGRIGIVAHSMGGIISRLLLANDSVASRTDAFFQIASPIEGSAKAYYTVKRRPTFGRILDSIWTFYHCLFPNRRHDMLSTLQEFDSIFQLMPDAPILVSAGGTLSPLDPTLWPPAAAARLANARRVQSLFRATPNGPCLAIGSAAIDTDTDYGIDSYGRITHKRKPMQQGDGTVTWPSARAHSQSLHRIQISPMDHQGLCTCDEVVGLLRATLSAD